MHSLSEKFITPHEVSIITGFSLSSLANQRSKKSGFPYYKYGRKIFYKESEVLSCLGANKVEVEAI